MSRSFEHLQYSPVGAELLEEANFLTAEQIRIVPNPTHENISGIEHLDFAAGFPPFLRGPYASMYVRNPWPSASTQDSAQLKRATRFTGVILQAVKRDYPLHLTLPRTADTTAITKGWKA